MKRVVRIIIGLIVFIIAILFAVNEALRVGQGSGESIGIIEKYLFQKSESSFQQSTKSDNYLLWDNASKDCDKLLDYFEEYGFSIIMDNELEEIRIEMIKLSSKASKNAKKVNIDYLRKTDINLPNIYTNKLIKSLDLFTEGLREKNEEKLNIGVQHYNEFIIWAQENREILNSMK